jgi:hypothetical protein
MVGFCGWAKTMPWADKGTKLVRRGICGADDDAESSAKGEKETGKEKYRYLGRMQRGCEFIPGDDRFYKDIQDVPGNLGCCQLKI